MRWVVLALCLLATPALAQNVQLQQDANGNIVQDFLRLASMHAVNLPAGGITTLDPVNDATRLLLVTCTSACNISQRASPSPATSANDFQLPANTVLRVRIRQGDGLGFRATSAGTAYVVELE